MRAKTLLIGLLLAVAAPWAAADGRPIRLVVPFTAGGGSDIVTRAFGQKLSEALGQPVVVDNRPGANGYIAAEFVARSAPDGTTLMVGGNALVIGPLLFSSHRLNAVKDFTPIATIVRPTLVMVVRPGFPAANARELVRLGREGRQAFSYASTSPGIMMTTEQIKALAGIDLLRVPYRGAPEAFIDVSTGRVSLMLDTVASQLANIRAGRAKAMVVNSETRHPSLPDVPTLAESGISGYEEDNYIGLLGPVGMDPALIAKLNAATARVLKDRDLSALLERQGFQPILASPREFTDMLSTTTVRYARIVQQLGIRPE